MTPKLVAAEIIAVLSSLIKSSNREETRETNKFLEIKKYFNVNLFGNECSFKAELFLNTSFSSYTECMAVKFSQHLFFFPPHISI